MDKINRVDKLNFIGFLSGDSGYSILSRALIALMDYAGIDVRAQDLNNLMIPELMMLQNKSIEDRFQLVHQLPSMYPSADIYYTVTEFDEPPYGCISPMAAARMILTESEFCKKVFEEFVDVPVHVLNYPIDPQFKPTGFKYEFEPPISKFRFKFLSVFEWCMRKDPYTLIEAFCEEFDKNEDVCLILRCWSKGTHPLKWITQLSKDHNVFWMAQQVPDLAPLYRAVDCYVTSTMGEGFGHTIAEAMACGIKVITPISTGMKDYCNKNNCIPVEFEKMEVKDTYAYKFSNEYNHLIKPWFKASPIKKESLMKAMRRAYRSEMKFVTDNAVKVRDKLNYDNILKQLKEAFNLVWLQI